MVQLSAEAQKANRKGYLIMVIGLFMAILDIQIVASSLGEIQASLSASLDEISWVQTAYLIAEVIMIPLTSWLVGVFSTRLVFSVACGLFTIASAACAFAWNLESMIIFRAIQGFFGGCLIPTVFFFHLYYFSQRRTRESHDYGRACGHNGSHFRPYPWRMAYQ